MGKQKGEGKSKRTWSMDKDGEEENGQGVLAREGALKLTPQRFFSNLVIEET